MRTAMIVLTTAALEGVLHHSAPVSSPKQPGKARASAGSSHRPAPEVPAHLEPQTSLGAHSTPWCCSGRSPAGAARRAINVRVASGNHGHRRGLAGHSRKGLTRAFACFPWSEDRSRAALGAGGRVFESFQPDKEDPLNKGFFVLLGDQRWLPPCNKRAITHGDVGPRALQIDCNQLRRRPETTPWHHVASATVRSPRVLDPPKPQSGQRPPQPFFSPADQQHLAAERARLADLR